MFTLGNGPTLLFDLKQWAFGVLARGRAMTFDAGLATGIGVRDCAGMCRMIGIPCVFFVAEDNLSEKAAISGVTGLRVQWRAPWWIFRSSRVGREMCWEGW